MTVELTQVPLTERLYKIEYRIVYIDRQENQIDVAFHEPGRMGFASIETAKEMVAVLEAADVKLEENRVYEILPILVSDHYQRFEPSIDFQLSSDEEDEMADMLGLKVPPQEPPVQGGSSSN